MVVQPSSSSPCCENTLDTFVSWLEESWLLGKPFRISSISPIEAVSWSSRTWLVPSTGPFTAICLVVVQPSSLFFPRCDKTLGTFMSWLEESWLLGKPLRISFISPIEAVSWSSRTWLVWPFIGREMCDSFWGEFVSVVMKPKRSATSPKEAVSLPLLLLLLTEEDSESFPDWSSLSADPNFREMLMLRSFPDTPGENGLSISVGCFVSSTILSMYDRAEFCFSLSNFRLFLALRVLLAGEKMDCGFMTRFAAEESLDGVIFLRDCGVVDRSAIGRVFFGEE